MYKKNFFSKKHVRSRKNLCRLLLGVMVIFPFVKAEGQMPSRSPAVTVFGHAAKEVPADRVIITLGIETESEDLNIAKSQNDARVNKVLGIVQDMGLPEENLLMSPVNIYPRYRNVYEQKTFAGYVVEKRIQVILKDISLHQSFLSAVLEAKVNYVHATEFQNSRIEEYQDEVRVEAVRAAEEKAQVLARALRREVGPPLDIEELPSEYLPQPLRPDEKVTAEGQNQAHVTGGKIPITSDVKVRFALIPSGKEKVPKREGQGLTQPRP